MRVSGVVVDGPRRTLQEFALRQRAAGVLICLCSKNVEEDVYAVLDGHPDMLLRREHVTAARINWNSKSENLRALAKELNLGLDSFVFLDDNAVECAEVRARTPEVLTLALPQDASRIASFLDHVWAFEGSALTKEDAKRAEFYQQEVERGALRQQPSSGFADFIASPRARGEAVHAGSGADRRVVHSSRSAPTSSTPRPFAARPPRRFGSSSLCRRICAALRSTLSRSFGDYGSGRRGHLPARAAKLWWSESLLLSCRALGRGVEHRLLADLARRTMARGLSRVEIPVLAATSQVFTPGVRGSSSRYRR